MTVIDLTLPIDETTPFHPDHFGPQVESYADIPTNGFAASRLTMSSHLGTHVDASCHYIDGGRTLEQIPLDVLVGPAQIISFGALAPRHEIQPDELPAITQQRVLLDTGWSAHLGQADYFDSHPYIGEAAAKALVDAGVQLVGLDCPSVDYPPSATHYVLLGADVVIVENVANLGAVTDGAMVAILPLPIRGGDGCPARAVMFG